MIKYQRQLQPGRVCFAYHSTPPPLPPELSSGDQVFRCLSLPGPFLVQTTTSRCATRTQFTELLAWRLWVPFETMWQYLLFLSSEFKAPQSLCLLETLCRRRGEIGRTAQGHHFTSRRYFHMLGLIPKAIN